MIANATVQVELVLARVHEHLLVSIDPITCLASMRGVWLVRASTWVAALLRKLRAIATESRDALADCETALRGNRRGDAEMGGTRREKENAAGGNRRVGVLPLCVLDFGLVARDAALFVALEYRFGAQLATPAPTPLPWQPADANAPLRNAPPCAPPHVLREAVVGAADSCLESFGDVGR